MCSLPGSSKPFFYSFGDAAPWTDEGITGDEAVGYFYNDIIGMETLGDDLRATRMVWMNVLFSAITWFIVFLCTAWGQAVVGRITYFTMGLPAVLLFVFLFRALTLDGSSDGIVQYIGKWEMSVLRDSPDVWSTAVSQIFFSIGVTFGIMTAYGSHQRRDEPAFFNATTVAICNSMFSFISGFAVFASMGHLAHLEGLDVADLKYSGFGLVFGTWPVVLGTMPGGIHWVRILFFDLFLLGLDSLFSMLEAVMTVARDTQWFKNVPKWKVSAVCCWIAFLYSLLYCTDAGLIWLDAIDYYINFTMLLVGFFETFALGWVYGINEQVRKFGILAVLAYGFANFGAVILGCIVWFFTEADTFWGFVAMFSFYGIGLGVTFVLKKSGSSMLDLAFGNVFEYRQRVRPVIGTTPAIFCILIKQFIPHILLIGFINLARTIDGTSGKIVFGHYSGYDFWPYQLIGIVAVAFAALLFGIGLVIPQVYKPFALRDDFEQPENAFEEAEETEDVKQVEYVEEVSDEKEAGFENIKVETE